MPSNDGTCWRSAIAPAIATPAASQLRTSIASAKAHDTVAPHAPWAPSMPNAWGFACTTAWLSRSGL
jgi:hypothetical protein